jgi:hypothetical protein
MNPAATRPAVLLGLGMAIAAYLLSFFHRVAPAAISGDLQATFAIGGAQLGHPRRHLLLRLYADADSRPACWLGHPGAAPHPVLGRAGRGCRRHPVRPRAELRTRLCRAHPGRPRRFSVAFIAMLKLLALGFDERRFATLTGLCMLIGNLGSILAGAPLAWATQAAGWRPVFVVVGLLSLFALAFRQHAPGCSKPRPARSIAPPGSRVWRHGD